MPFFIIFILIPLMEIYVFMQVGEMIGLGTTLFLALFTAILGGAIIKHQGITTLQAVSQSMRQGKMPVTELFDGFCLIAAGATLITPGFVTDTIGFLLLIPPFRRILQTFVSRYTKITGSGFYKESTGNKQNPFRQESNVIEGDYVRLEDEEPKP